MVSRRIKVLVIFGNIPLYGKERGNIQVFKALKEVGIEALFITHKEYGHLHIQPTLDGLGLRWTEGTFPGRFSHGMSVKEWLDRLRELFRGIWDFMRVVRTYRPMHIHVGSEGQFANLIPALWMLRTPVVFRLGDAPRNHRWLFRWLWRWCIIPRVSQFVCISTFIKQRLIEAGASDNKIRVIYNFPPERPGLPSNEEDVPQPFEGHTVLYMGQLSKQKGLGLLVEAAIALCTERRDVRFLIAGDYAWRNPLAQALIERVRDLGLQERICFLGYMESIPQLLAVSDVHVCPSVIPEALGNVVLEAKQAGVPSVIFPSGGLPELVTHRLDGFICREKTVAGLKEGIGYYLDLGSAGTRQAGEQARRSLDRLGITKSQFTAAWQAVYDGVS